MAKRHREALLIQEGACNPSGIARYLVTAIDEAKAEGIRGQDCPAVRLIAHQLGFILKVPEIDGSTSVHGELTRECQTLRDVG